MASNQNQAPTSQTDSSPAPQTQKRRRTPTIVQMEATESGAVALSIILGFYGRFVEMEEMRKACGISRDGAPPDYLVQAAKAYGLDAELHDGTNTGEVMTLPTPLIARFEGGQYVVVEGYTAQELYVNDPSSGVKKMSRADFKSALGDVAITLKPGPDFKKGGQPPSVMRALARRLQGNSHALLFVVLASLGLIFPRLLVPIFTQIFIDNFLSNELSSQLLGLLIGMGVTAVLLAALTWFQSQFLLRLRMKLAVTMSAEFFWHVLRLPMTFFTQRYRGEIGSRIGLNDTVASLLSQELVLALLNLVLALFYLVLMLYYSVLLTLVAVGFGIINIVVLRLISRLISDSSKQMLQERGKLLGVSMNGITMIETLKATGTEADFFARWSGLQARVYNSQQALSAPTQILNSVPTLLNGLSTAVTLVVGGWLIMDNNMTVGMLVAFQAFASSFLDPMGDLLDLGSTYQETKSALFRLDDLLETDTDPALPDPVLPGSAALRTGTTQLVPPQLSGALELRNVTFGYNRLEPPLIENFNLILSPGSRVALVGSTGSGKSTVANLVVGLYEPWSGEILFDDKPRTAINHRVVTNSLSKVDQDIFLFSGTVMENLTLWDPTIPSDQVVAAAVDACIHDTIAARPGAYHSHVEEGGSNYSGGQAQRLEIARALVMEPTLLILDEATSALDPPTEAEIDQNLRRRGCTCLIVAHRLSTIRDCDEIIVLQHGKVAQRGTHQEMVQVDGPYRELIQAQGALGDDGASSKEKSAGDA